MTSDEQAGLNQRRNRFHQFMVDKNPALVAFAGSLGLRDPHRIVDVPSEYVDGIAAFLREQDVSDPGDREWALIHLGYFIGEYLRQRLSGQWFLNEISGSRFFMRHVVGRFARVSNALAMIDPYGIASDYLLEPPGRDLGQLLTEVENEIVASRDPRNSDGEHEAR